MQSKRDDILAAALMVFQEEGLKGARMERIAQTAQVSKRTLYKYFDTKEALFEAISAMVLDILSRMELPTFDPGQPIRPQLVRALMAYADQTLTPAFLNGSRVIQPEFMRSPEAALRFGQTYQQIDAPLAGFVRDAMIAGVLRSGEPSTVTDILLARFKSLLLIPVILNLRAEPARAEVSEMVESSVDAFLATHLRTA